MTSGRKALADLNRQVESLRAQLKATSARLDALTGQAEQSQAEEGREVARLARLRLDDLAARRVGESLGAAEREAMVQMAQRQVAQERCEADIQASVARQQALESERTGLGAQRDALLVQFERAYAEVAERTRASAQWQALDERADRLSGQAALAQEKAALAEADRRQKGAPYEADRLFVYLWQRQYGGAGYRAGALTRALDGWVARLVRFADAARNYRLLVALPLHLRRHADELVGQAEAARAELARMEEQALAAAGVDTTGEQLQALEQRIDALAAQVAGEEQRHAGLLARRGALAEGSDEFTAKALAALARAIEQAPSERLRRVAQATPGDQDDRAVAVIERSRGVRAQLVEQLESSRREHAGQMSTLQRVEELRRRFREERYDSGDSELDDLLDWDDMLGGVLRGVLEMTRAWERVQRHQRFRVPKSMRLPGGIFGGGSSRSGGGGFGGGIFKGGGGFGGGGFKSGGGF